MVKYFCNHCKCELSSKAVVQVLDKEEKKRTYHFCDECFRKVQNFLSYGATWTGSKSPVEPGYPPEVLTGVKEESKEEVKQNKREIAVSQLGRVPDRMFKCVCSNGKSMEDAFDEGNSVMELDPIPRETAERYLHNLLPQTIGICKDTAGALSMLIGFYRGRKKTEIQKQLGMQSNRATTILQRYASMRAYERWLEPTPFQRSDGSPVDVGAVLSMVEALKKPKDIVLDTRLENEDQFFEILEYYLMLGMNETCKERYIFELSEV